MAREGVCNKQDERSRSITIMSIVGNIGEYNVATVIPRPSCRCYGDCTGSGPARAVFMHEAMQPVYWKLSERS